MQSGLGVIPVELADVDRGLDRSGALAATIRTVLDELKVELAWPGCRYPAGPGCARADASNNAHSKPWACQDLSARVGPGRGEITMAGF